MPQPPPPLRGRGASANPPNRFIPIAYEPDPDGAGPEESPAPQTQFFRDTSRSAIAFNDSPDVGFEASINPYRGCEHGCVYCLSGDTRILTADGATKALADVRPGDGIAGTVGERQGTGRRGVRTEVLDHWSVEEPAFRVVLEDGTTLVASGDHRFLTERGWKRVAGGDRSAEVGASPLAARDRLVGLGTPTALPVGAPFEAEGRTGAGIVKLGVRFIEGLGSRNLFDITTGTGDFIANGVVSHNCYARPTHEYLGFSAGLDFETRILIKEDAPELLRHELAAPGWKPQVLAMSGVTDPYQPIERRLALTRRCLEVLVEFRNPVAIITKNRLVTRDVDLLRELARHRAAAVFLSITTLRSEVHRVMEPRTSHPEARLEAIRALAAAGVPAGVLVAPVIPGLTDHEMPAILKAAAAAGARHAGYTVLRLPYAVKELFTSWLAQHFLDRRDKVLHRLGELRGGRLNDPRFGTRMSGEGIFAEQIAALFKTGCRDAGIERRSPELSTDAFRRPSGRQLTFFD